ncbi:hypothetical protein ACOMCU_27815, partial [Lysinibacillus sp. UGB7]|uniref:hypothetical protein n=1 Tax=Lysinibacillus sp. UGB7 TaxID=3411039 RepID=UPI003B7E3B58
MIFKEIDYKNMNHRKVNGLFYVKKINEGDKKYNQDKSSISIVMTPDNKILKPAFDYICALNEKSKGRKYIESCSVSISHFYNFLLLHDLTGEEPLTSNLLDLYIKYLSYIPKGLYKMPGFNSIHPSDIEYIPIHPYIDGITNKNTISSIYNEWYKKLGNTNAIHMILPSLIRAEIDEEGWRYSFEYIAKTIRKTLDYLEWLSEDCFWSRRFKPLSREVVSKTFIKIEKDLIEVWDIAGRITNKTDLKRKDNSIVKKRVFTEYEIEKIFSNEIIGLSTQKNIFFTILLHSGARVSEILNLLLFEEIVEIKGKGSHKYYEVKWEELLTRNPHMNVVTDNQMDILIDTE